MIRARPSLGNAVMRWCAGALVKPALHRYLGRDRETSVLGLQLLVPAGVFHPRFFFSSDCFGRWLERYPLDGKKVLDVGTGSGVLALVAARCGASVTAVDINPVAVHAAQRNAKANALQVRALVSDLFEAVADTSFDLVVANPPYFEGVAVDLPSHAWRAGPQLQWFRQFFAYVGPRIGGELGAVAMVLADNCDLSQIGAAAQAHGLALVLDHSELAAWERQYIFTLVKA